MNVMKHFVTILTLLLPASLQAEAPTASIPVRFLGEWAASPQLCGSGTDDLALTITPNRVRYRESEGPVKAVVLRGNTEIAWIAELSGEGETWLATATLKLPKNGQELVDSTTVPEREIVRHKCGK